MEKPSLILRQRAFFESGVTRSAAFRRERLRALLDALDSNESELLEALREDLGKPPLEAYTSEIGFLKSEIRHVSGHLDRWMKPVRRRAPALAWPASASIHPEPFGVALILGPWNYPLQLLLGPAVAAIAAGNCAVLKPSELAPHTSQAVVRLVGTAFEEDFLAVVEGGRETAVALLEEKSDVVFFTGGTEAGRAVMAAAARHLTPVILELGGKSPCIVCADAPLEITAGRIAWGKFLNAGQTCVAPDYVLVDRRISDGLIDALKQTIRGFFGDHPQQSADFGRIVNRRHFDRLTGLLGDGEIVHGGGFDAADRFIEPTLMRNPAADSAVMREEIFGPILPVLEFDDLDQVLSGLRQQATPLALYFFSARRDLQQRILMETRSGGVCFNDTVSHILARELPFGGLGESGMGSYHGRAGFDAFSHRRSVLRRPFSFEPSFRYPPPRIALPSLKSILRILGGG